MHARVRLRHANDALDVSHRHWDSARVDALSPQLRVARMTFPSNTHMRAILSWSTLSSTGRTCVFA